MSTPYLGHWKSQVGLRFVEGHTDLKQQSYTFKLYQGFHLTPRLKKKNHQSDPLDFNIKVKSSQNEIYFSWNLVKRQPSKNVSWNMKLAEPMFTMRCPHPTTHIDWICPAKQENWALEKDKWTYHFWECMPKCEFRRQKLVAVWVVKMTLGVQWQ